MSCHVGNGDGGDRHDDARGVSCCGVSFVYTVHRTGSGSDARGRGRGEVPGGHPLLDAGGGAQERPRRPARRYVRIYYSSRGQQDGYV